MELNTLQKRKLKELAEKYQLRMMILFGSQVRKQPRQLHQESDVDVAYLSKKDLSGKEIIALDCDLIDVFSQDRVDLTNLRQDNPFLRYEIAKNSQLLYGKEMDYLEFKAFAFKDYVNHQPLFDLTSILIRRRHLLLREKIYGK
ncbi:nucleotidyltransferase domain-containing protein [Patescibacteria group bacterium]|nr:nucleotidyltransferase domain-containing protein [Patescibacteria group bacterium]